MTVLTALADAFLMKMARTETINFCFIGEREVESFGLQGYSTPSVRKVPSVLSAFSRETQPEE